MRSDYRPLKDRAGHTKYLVRRISERACITEPLELGAADAGVFADEVLRDAGDEPFGQGGAQVVVIAPHGEDNAAAVVVGGAGREGPRRRPCGPFRASFSINTASWERLNRSISLRPCSTET